MADRFVTVASYNFAPVAQMAKNLLESEGIPVILAGEFTATALTGMGDEMHLQVREDDAARATSILAAAEASLDPDWETQAETNAGVWPCPLCDTAVSKELKICPVCQTPNQHITTDRRDTYPGRRVERGAEKEPASEQVQDRTPPARAAEDATKPAGGGCATLIVLLLLALVGQAFLR